MAGDEDAQEREAVARSQRGDREAFNTLVVRHQSAAYSVALRMLGDPAVAADVTQDAFLSAFRNIGSFRGASFRAWVLRIVSNGCYSYWRAQRRRPAESLDALLADETGHGYGHGHGQAADTPADQALASALSDLTWNPEGAALRAEVIAALEAALLRLPADQRLALILSDIQGLPYEEIARVTDAPLGTIKSRIARGRARLRELLLAQPELFGRGERQDVRED